MANKYAQLLGNINNEKLDEDEHVLIIDGLNLFLRSFTMINQVNVNAHHIGGLVGSLKSIGYAIKMLSPTKVIIVFDGVGGSNAKRNLYADYKGNRHVSRMTNHSLFNSKEEENDSIANQMERLISYLKCLPLSLICIDGIEADDVMSSLVAKYEANPKTKSIILSSADQDFLQLISDKTSIYSPIKKKLYNFKLFQEEYGLCPHNYIIYKTFLGDKGDNVPKIKGFGEAKLLKLIPQIKEKKQLSLDEAISLVDNNDKWGCQLLNFTSQLKINYQLMNLKDVHISNENMDIIDNSINQRLSVDKISFMTMYVSDLLGDSIPNTSEWVDRNFNSLCSFK